MKTHFERERAGYQAFTPDADPDELNPYHGRSGWLVKTFSADWMRGWCDAEKDYKKKPPAPVPR
jgi:hypothetical protein